VLSVAATVIEHVGGLAAGDLQRVGQDRHPVEGAVVMNRECEDDGGGRESFRVEGDGAEGVAEDVAEEVGLREALGPVTSAAGP